MSIAKRRIIKLVSRRASAIGGKRITARLKLSRRNLSLIRRHSRGAT